MSDFKINAQFSYLRMVKFYVLNSRDTDPKSDIKFEEIISMMEVIAATGKFWYVILFFIDNSKEILTSVNSVHSFVTDGYLPNVHELHS